MTVPYDLFGPPGGSRGPVEHEIAFVEMAVSGLLVTSTVVPFANFVCDWLDLDWFGHWLCDWTDSLEQLYCLHANCTTTLADQMVVSCCYIGHVFHLRVCRVNALSTVSFLSGPNMLFSPSSLPRFPRFHSSTSTLGTILLKKLRPAPPCPGTTFGLVRRDA